MRRALFVVVSLAAVKAFAAPRTAVVSGDCSDPALISATKDFRDAAGKLLGPQLMDPEAVLDIVRPRPTRSLEDVERQVASAKALFYGGHPDRALELVERALVELERASPEAKPWPVTASALVLLALVEKGLERPKEMTDAFRRLARIDPEFQLDRDAHPPSVIAVLDAVKKELGRARKSSLLVRAETGPAALVFVDGHPMGQTPLTLSLVPGTYRISLTAPGMVSFPHRVELPRDTKLNVDLAFEGRVGSQAPPCLLGGADDTAALKLGQLVTAGQLIVLRNAAKAGAPTVLSGALFDLSTGKQERFASVSPEYLANLAVFLVTGKEQAGLLLEGAAPMVAPPVEPKPALVPEPPVMDPRQPTFELDPKPGANGGRVASFSLLGIGGAAVLAGVLTFTAFDADRRRLVGITLQDGRFRPSSVPAGQEALDRMAQLDTIQQLSFALIGGGVGALAAGAVGLAIFPTAQPGAASVQVSGRF